MANDYRSNTELYKFASELELKDIWEHELYFRFGIPYQNCKTNALSLALFCYAMYTFQLSYIYSLYTVTRFYKYCICSFLNRRYSTPYKIVTAINCQTKVWPVDADLGYNKNNLCNLNYGNQTKDNTPAQTSFY